MEIFYFFLKRSKVVNLISFMVLVLGVLAVTQMNRDTAPPLNFNRVLVEVEYPESTASDLEKEVVFPIEEKLMNFPGIKQISSNSYKGGARIWISFPANYKEMGQATNEIRQIVDSIKLYLPESIRNIRVSERKINSNFQSAILIQNYNLESKDHRLWLESLKNELSQVRGISAIEDDHLPKRSIKIDLQEDLMKSYEVSTQLINAKVSEFLTFRPLGTLRKGNKFTFIEFNQDIESEFIENLRNTIIHSNSLGYQTKLKQVAKVDFYFPEVDEISFVDHKQIYYISLMKDLNSDVISLQAKVDEILKEKNKNSYNIKLTSTISGKGFIERQLTALKGNGILGGLIVFFVLILFLSLSTSFFTIWGIPFCYCATFLTMYMMGFGIDILSIVGLILVSGMLVDDALIVSEKYNEGLESGLTPMDSSRKAIKELFIPVCGTILTTVVAFLPLILIPSDLGNILVSIPIVLISALVFSLIESFFILPNHLQHFSKKSFKTRAHIYFEKIKLNYEKLTTSFLNWKYTVSLFFVLSTGLIFYSSYDVEKDFNLNISDDFVQVEGELVNSESKEETLKKISKLYDSVKSYADKKDFVSVELDIGVIWQSGEKVINDKVFRILARVQESHPQPTAVKDQLLANLKNIIDTAKNKKDIFKSISANKTWRDDEADKSKYLTINFYTKNTTENLDFKTSLESLPEKIKGIGALDLGEDKSVDKWVFKPNYEKMANLSVSKQDLQTAILGKLDDNWLKEVRIEGKAYPVNFTINGTELSELDFKPSEINVLTANQNYVNLSSLGQWKLLKTPKTISHLNGYKVQGGKFKITDEKNREKIVLEAKKFIKTIDKKFPEHIIKASGESLQEAENKSWILKSLLACILGIFFVLALTLNSLSQPLIVSLPIPFATAGVMLMHKLHGLPLGVFSMIGLIGAIGVSVNGTLIMSDQINIRLRKLKNLDLKTNVALGSSSRLRAIFLTSMTTLGGLFPMAYAIGGDSGFTRPLAFSMAWGIVFASVMTLFFFPSIYLALLSCVQKLEHLFSQNNISLKKLFNSQSTKKEKDEVHKPDFKFPEIDS